MNEHHDVAVAAAKATPPLAVTSGTLAGMPLPDVVLWATLAYTVFQLIAVAPRAFDSLVKCWRWVRSRVR